MKKIKIAIVEREHEILSAILQQFDKEKLLEIVASGDNIESLWMRLEQKTIDVLIIGVSLSFGYHTVKKLYTDLSNIKVIIYSHFEVGQDVIETGSLLVKAFVGKQNYQDLYRAIKIVYEGGVFLSDEFSFIIQKYLAVSETKTHSIGLSRMEKLLLIFICKGLSSSQIANELSKSPRTIEKYRQDLYDKFGVGRKEQLIVKAFKMSLLE